MKEYNSDSRDNVSRLKPNKSIGRFAYLGFGMALVGSSFVAAYDAPNDNSIDRVDVTIDNKVIARTDWPEMGAAILAITGAALGLMEITEHVRNKK